MGTPAISDGLLIVRSEGYVYAIGEHRSAAQKGN